MSLWLQLAGIILVNSCYCISSVHSTDPTGNSSSLWLLHVAMGSRVNISCHDSVVDVFSATLPDTDLRYWILPPTSTIRNSTVGPGWSEGLREGRSVSADGRQLVIGAMRQVYSGIYYCAVLEEGVNGSRAWHFLTRAVNLYGPYVPDTTQRHLGAIVGSVSAAGTFFCTVALCYLVYKFRYKNPGGVVDDEEIVVTNTSYNTFNRTVETSVF